MVSTSELNMKIKQKLSKKQTHRFKRENKAYSSNQNENGTEKSTISSQNRLEFVLIPASGTAVNEAQMAI